MLEPTEEVPSPPVQSPAWWRRAIAWMGAHKVKTLLLAISVFLFGELLSIPWFGVASLQTEDPPETALMRQRLKEAEGQKTPLKILHSWIPLSRIPAYAIDAIIVAEDGTFFEHGGIDWFEVQESIEKNMEEGRAARGASTITQQLAKNLYLSTSKDPIRKLKELLITLLMESQLSKRRILEIYVNSIEWGRGVFGIEAAARTFFGKSAQFLTLDEAVRLAAVIPSPLRHRPDDNSRYVVRRKQIVLNRMNARRILPGEADRPRLDVPAETVPNGSDPPNRVPDSSGTAQEDKNEL